MTWAFMANPKREIQKPVSVHSTDAGLATRLLHRDESALAEVYDLYAGMVFGVLSRMVNHALAQEVTQDVFLRLWERPEAYDFKRAGLKSYLLVMARSRGLDVLRAQKQTTTLYTEDGMELPLPDQRIGPEGESEAAQRRERIREILAELSDHHREVVERAYLQGQTRAEIAEATGVPVGTVKSRLSYALKHLKRVLGEEVSVWLD